MDNRINSIEGTTEEVKQRLLEDLASMGSQMFHDSQLIKELCNKLLETEKVEGILDLLEEYNDKIKGFNIDFIAVSQKARK